MSVTKPCPRCQTPLQIPQPTPEQIRCPRCGAVIRKKASPGEGVAATPETFAAPAAAPRGNLKTMLLMFLCGILFMGVLTAVGIGFAMHYLEEQKTADLKKTEDDTPEEKTWAEEKPQDKKTGDKTIEGKDSKGIKTAEKPKDLPPLSPGTRTAVDKGAAYLKNRILEKTGPLLIEPQWGIDSIVGTAALAGLALLEAGVPPQDPALQKVIGMVRKEGPVLKMGYTISTVLFFLNRLHDIEPLPPADRDLLRSLSLRLVAGQIPQGQWTYLNLPIAKKAEDELLQQLSTNKYLPRNNTSGTQGYHGDHSVTQFALIALWGSLRHQVPVRPALMAAAMSFHKNQADDGTWDYPIKKSTSWTDSNTCAGLIALAIEKTLREDKLFQAQSAGDPPADPRADERRDLAFAYLSRIVGSGHDAGTGPTGKAKKIVRANAHGDYYFLWCVERVAMIYDLKSIGGKEWYQWGSDILVQDQRENGSWNEAHGEVADTCFAMLFLSRTNLARDLTESIVRRRRD